MNLNTRYELFHKVDSYGYQDYKIAETMSILDYFGNEEAWKSKYISPVAHTKEWELIADELGEQGHTNIFNYQLFNRSFCEEIIKLAETANCWTEKRHEFYPTTDMLLNTIGMNDIYEAVLEEFIYPFAIESWALEGKTWEKLKGENFLIKYIPEQQAHLSFHHDWSLFTSLAVLNDEFEGGGTYFKRQKLCVKGDVGSVNIHPGNITHKHGARPITSGLRYVIVSFVNSEN